jgi:hypothetical protein
MKSLRLLLLPALLLLLTSCAVTVQPGAPFDVQAVGVSDTTVINSRLGLRGYPGATVMKHEDKGSSSDTTFESGGSLDAVYNHFHNQLRGQGWERVELEVKSNKIEAGYRSGGEKVSLELNREGQSGRFRLKVDLD